MAIGKIVRHGNMGSLCTCVMRVLQMHMGGELQWLEPTLIYSILHLPHHQDTHLYRYECQSLTETSRGTETSGFLTVTKKHEVEQRWNVLISPVYDKWMGRLASAKQRM